MEKTRLELLSPARNKEFGMAAICHGADAVYIGAERFSARSAAGNRVSEIEALADYAHLYNARVYVALNTLLFDHELESAETLIRQLWNAGADALIIQDMGILEMDLPPISLFASTQTDNRTVEQVRFLEENGFERVILARELSLDAIHEIREQTRVDLEVFVHGALCACYSGQCYFSAAIGKRSANRGECGQPCRLAWDLLSETGQVLEKGRHLLSLKDMNRSNALGLLARAGITSFKIEGRLKDLSYVKNITAFYRKKLDEIMLKESGYDRASSGRTVLFFDPDPLKTFNRGETGYFLTDPDEPIHSFDTPKSMGEKIGTVDTVDPKYLILKGRHDLHNGDGLCYVGRSGKLSGFQVNRMEREKIVPAGRLDLKKTGLFPGAVLYRNHNHAFLKLLLKPSAQRRIALDMIFRETENGFTLQAKDEDGTRAEVTLVIRKIEAKDQAAAMATLNKQLGKMGDSLFYLNRLITHSRPYFLTTRDLNHARRDLVEKLTQIRAENYQRKPASPRKTRATCPRIHLDFTANVTNKKAAAFYRKRGVETIDPAFELSHPGPGTVVMTLRHCIQRALGKCTGRQGLSKPGQGEAFFIEHGNDRFRVEFDCRKCEMRIRRT